jgi:hypothetical protein
MMIRLDGVTGDLHFVADSLRHRPSQPHQQQGQNLLLSRVFVLLGDIMRASYCVWALRQIALKDAENEKDKKEDKKADKKDQDGKERFEAVCYANHAVM